MRSRSQISTRERDRRLGGEADGVGRRGGGGGGQNGEEEDKEVAYTRERIETILEVFRL